MAWFQKEKRKEKTLGQAQETEKREENSGISQKADDEHTVSMLSALFGRSRVSITEREALEIPAVASCVSFIADKVSMLPLRLYQRTGPGTVKEVIGDPRLRFLNDASMDALNPSEQKKALIYDYFLYGNGYCYIARHGNAIQGLYYVSRENVTVQAGTDPIYKQLDFRVRGALYRDFEFITLIRRASGTGKGRGILQENALLLSVAYQLMKLENIMNQTGGNKKGFFESQKRLTESALAKLREDFNNMYANNDKNVMFLNEGIKFHESSNTSVEMQMAENKESNSRSICSLFGLSPEVVSGTATEEQYNNAIKSGVIPVLQALEAALNHSLLLESEKGRLYFAADTKELLRGDLVKRWQAYGIAVDHNIMQIDEVRANEDLPPLGMKYIKLGLSDVLYNPETKEVYTPNTNQTARMEALNQQGKEESNAD